MSKWYGSLQNRLEENRMFCKAIEVGTGVTEYSWSDRHPYEVVEVRDQKHVVVRELGHRPVGEPMSNDWELFSDPTKSTRCLVKWGKYWYWTSGFGKGVSRSRANVSFGTAQYYYDYSF